MGNEAGAGAVWWKRRWWKLPVWAWIVVGVVVVGAVAGSAGGDDDDAGEDEPVEQSAVPVTSAPDTVQSTAVVEADGDVGEDEPVEQPAVPVTSAPDTVQSTAVVESNGDDGVSEGEGDPVCLELLEAAAAVDELHDTVQDFYPALDQCSELDAWSEAATETGALDGVDPVLFAYNACTSGGPDGSPVCVEAVEADPLGLEALDE